MDHAYCPKCHEPRDAAAGTPCGVCGTELWSYDSPAEYVFTKEKGFSYLMYKEITTEARFTDQSIEISQTNTWFAFFKQPSTSISIPYAEIQEVTMYRSWDFWNLALAALVTLISNVCRWYWFLGVLFFLWLAMGKTIAIYYKDGSVWRIPIGNFALREKQFAAEVQQRMPKGVV